MHRVDPSEDPGDAGGGGGVDVPRDPVFRPYAHAATCFHHDFDPWSPSHPQHDHDAYIAAANHGYDWCGLNLGHPPPELRPHIHAAKYCVEPDPHNAPITFKNGDLLEPKMKRLIRRAWLMMRRNRDVIDWILCILLGIGGQLRSAVREIITDGLEVVITSQDPDDDDKDACFSGGSDLSICAGGAFYRHYRRFYDFDEVDCVRNMCLAIDLAATLLHEVIHVAEKRVGGWQYDDFIGWYWVPPEIDQFDGGHNEACDEPGNVSYKVSFLAENAFRWAMGKRYPLVMEATAADGRPLCDYYRKSETWMCDESLFPNVAPSCHFPWICYEKFKSDCNAAWHAQPSGIFRYDSDYVEYPWPWFPP